MFDRVTPLFLVLMKKQALNMWKSLKILTKSYLNIRKVFTQYILLTCIKNIGTENQLIHIYFQRIARAQSVLAFMIGEKCSNLLRVFSSTTGFFKVSSESRKWIFASWWHRLLQVLKIKISGINLNSYKKGPKSDSTRTEILKLSFNLLDT